MTTEHSDSNSHTDTHTSRSTQEYLKVALEHTIAAGHSVRDFSEFALEKFGDASLPHIRHFFQEIRHGQIKIKGMTRAAKARIVGLHVSATERNEMIRLAAYLRAERRGFVGGSPEHDWREAEKEVDAQLEHEAGLVEKGHKVLTSASTIVEREFDHIKHVVSEWIEAKFSETQKPVKKASPKKAAARKSSSTRPSLTKVTKSPAKKKSSSKKSTGKTAVVKGDTTRAANAAKKASKTAKVAPKKKAATKKSRAAKK